jgi:hypothetical protein
MTHTSRSDKPYISGECYHMRMPRASVIPQERHTSTERTLELYRHPGGSCRPALSALGQARPVSGDQFHGSPFSPSRIGKFGASGVGILGLRTANTGLESFSKMRGKRVGVPVLTPTLRSASLCIIAFVALLPSKVNCVSRTLIRCVLSC